MGDRANIVVKRGEEQVCLYTHWSGSNLPAILQQALARGESRWDDYQYLTRIIFCSMISKEFWADLTGYGITQVPYDGAYRIITVDVDAQTVTMPRGQPISFRDFITSAASW